MASADSTNSALGADWKALCRRATAQVRQTLAEFPDVAARGAPRGTGRGGDTTMAIDLAAEDIVIAELEGLGLPLTLISEERGELEIAGGGPVRVVVDPIDGSRNAKRRVPFFALSIAVAEGATAGDVVYGFVSDLTRDEEWWAERGGGAFLDGERLAPLADGELELLGLETTRPELLARAAPALEACGASRVRSLGSIALSMCWVAAGWLDAMASLRPGRSIDLAAAQLLVREAGGTVALPDVGPDPLAAPLTLEMRSRVYAASGPRLMERVVEIAT